VPAPILPAVTLVKALALLLVAIWLLQLERSLGARTPPALSLSLAAFAIWTTLSVGWAAEKGAALADVGRLAILIGTAIVGIAVMRRRDDVVTVAMAFIAGAAVAAGMGLLTGIGSEGGRLAGTVGDANELAVALVAALALVPPILVRSRRGSVPYVIVALAGALVLIGLVMTGSRGGAFSLVGAAMVALMMGRRWWRWAVPILGISAAVALLIVSGVRLPGGASHLNDSATVDRTTLWTIALRMAEAHPLTGVGVGSFVADSSVYLVRPGLVTRSDLVLAEHQLASNTYLEIAADRGVIGLLTFAAFLVLAGASATRAARRFARAGEDDMAFLAQAFVIGLVGIAVGAFFLSLEVNKQLWLVAAVCVGLYRIAFAPPGDSGKQPPLGDFSAGRLVEVGQ